MKLGLAGAFLLLLVASAQAQEREPAPPPQDPSVATIRGDIETGTFSTSWTRVMAMDGRVMGGPLITCARHDLTPGPHSLLIAYDSRLLPLRLDAKAGDAFVIKWKGTEDEILYVENETTGETVYQKQLTADARVGTYVFPAGDPSGFAVIKAESKKVDNWLRGEIDEADINISGIDGENPGLKVRSATLLPGTRALLFSIAFKVSTNPSTHAPVYAWASFPVLLDAKPGAVYALQYEKPEMGLLPGSRITPPTPMTIWIVDEKTGETALPRFSMLSNVDGRISGINYDERVSFTDKKAKRPPPKPKQWCEHD